MMNDEWKKERFIRIFCRSSFIVHHFSTLPDLTPLATKIFLD